MDKFVKVTTIACPTLEWKDGSTIVQGRVLITSKKSEAILNTTEIAALTRETWNALDEKKAKIGDYGKVVSLKGGVVDERTTTDWKRSAKVGVITLKHGTATNRGLNGVDYNRTMAITLDSYAEIEKVVLAGDSVI